MKTVREFIEENQCPKRYRLGQWEEKLSLATQLEKADKSKGLCLFFYIRITERTDLPPLEPSKEVRAMWDLVEGLDKEEALKPRYQIDLVLTSITGTLVNDEWCVLGPDELIG